MAEEKKVVDEEEARNLMKNMSNKGLLILFINTFHSRAWSNLGLIPNEAGEIKKDLAEARIAIDACQKIMEVLQDLVDEKEKDVLNNLVSTLQLNYVNQMSKDNVNSQKTKNTEEN